MADLTSTQDKINMKDHDILIAVHTLQMESMRRFDDYLKSNEERHRSNEREVGEMARNLIRTDGDITQIKGMVNALDERIDKLESKNLWMTAGSYVGVIIAGVIAWLK